MSKIQPEPSTPKAPPAPKKTPRTSSAPPFTPAQPKPRPSAAPSPQSAAPARRQPAKAAKQTRAAMQAAPDERAALQGRMREALIPDLAGAPNANTRFDSGNGTLPGGFFAEFAEDTYTPDAWPKNGSGAPLGATALDDPLDCTALASLLPCGENDGIFDVVLPSGDRLGVVVSGRPSSLSYLLSPSTEKLGSRLRRHRMELEESLEQLTHRNVKITVL